MPSAEELQVRGINLAGEEVAHLRLAKEDGELGLSRSCSLTKSFGGHLPNQFRATRTYQRISKEVTGAICAGHTPGVATLGTWQDAFGLLRVTW